MASLPICHRRNPSRPLGERVCLKGPLHAPWVGSAWVGPAKLKNQRRVWFAEQFDVERSEPISKTCWWRLVWVTAWIAPSSAFPFPSITALPTHSAKNHRTACMVRGPNQTTNVINRSYTKSEPMRDVLILDGVTPRTKQLHRFGHRFRSLQD
jgi:hypothetical protein